MDFPTRIVELKVNKNLLQKDMAAAAGVSPRHYQRYEKGEQQPTLPIITKLCQFFNISADWLLGLSDEQRPLYNK